MADDPPRLTVTNDELVTVRDAMRELNRMIDRFGDPHRVEKFVLMRGTQMLAVVLPLEGYADLLRRLRSTPFAQAWAQVTEKNPDQKESP